MKILSRIFSPCARIGKAIGNAIMRFAMPKLYRAGSLGNPVRGDTKAAQPSPEDLVRLSHAEDYEVFDEQAQKLSKEERAVRAAGFIC